MCVRIVVVLLCVCVFVCLCVGVQYSVVEFVPLLLMLEDNGRRDKVDKRCVSCRGELW